jgi:Ser/Thr protein kinase RdoA (MazF antagonist)
MIVMEVDMQDFEKLPVEEQEIRLLELASASLASWNLEGDLRLIKHRENAVYELNTKGGERFALRVHRAGYHSDQSLKSELQWIDALNDYGIGVPAVIPTSDGSAFAKVSIGSVPDDRQVDLFAWVDGEQLGSIEEELGDDPDAIKHIYKTIGRVGAKMHNQALQWELPAGFIRHSWDVDGLVGDNPLWGRFWELKALTTEQRDLISRARETVRQGLDAFEQPKDAYSLIHADFVPENFLVAGDKVQIIDFDDAGFGWHLFDLATALYFIQDDLDYDIARSALIEGYREFRPLADEELEQLPLFTAARSFTYLGWVHTRQETETARELTPMLVDMCCQACRQLLQD